MKLALIAVFGVSVFGQSHEDLIAQQKALDQARRETSVTHAAELYQAYIERYGGELVWDEIAKRDLFTPMIERQVKLEHWESAERVGAAAVKEIDAGRVGDQIALRRFYIQALEHRKNFDEAKIQFAGIEKLSKADLLASEFHQAAPPLAAKSVDGKEVSLSRLRGKMVMVAFWATWCAPCLDELRELNRAYPQYRKQLEVLAINTDDSAETAAAFAAKNQYSFPVFTPGSAEWSVATIPQLYFIDRNGNVHFHFEGFDNDGLFSQKIEWMIEAAQK